jgi:tetraacyldisaccharide 4'-kinase
MHWLERHWYRRSPVSALLLPVALLYCGLVMLRRAGYRLGLLPSVRLPAPVVVVGNLTVGGTGKTPLVIWLAQLLRAHGYRPGIVTRGYGGQASSWPQTVRADSNPVMVGDEPVLLARSAHCPVIADPDRVRAAQTLVVQQGCNVVLSDDGLQHYRLARDVEIAVIDGTRRFGNGWCLPAGPLREPITRLKSVDARVTQGEPAAGEWGMTLVDQGFYRLGESQPSAAVESFRGKTVHAVAGIGNPKRFFDRLRRRKLVVIEHPFPDHHVFRASDFPFGEGHAVIMTEKDAVKCERLGVSGWYLKVAARPDTRFGEWLLRRLQENFKEERRG